MKEWSKRINIHYQHFILLFVGSIIIYAELMINQLTNDYDGLWENSYHYAGPWELSLGRWFWQYISRARFGISPDPYTSLLTLAIMVVGLLFLYDLWQITDKYTILLSGLLFISHSAICFELSYRYMSPTYGVAFFLSILAVWSFEKISRPAISILAGSLCIAFSMGSYQAYICCTTVAFLTTLLIKLFQNISWKNISVFFVKSITGIVLGGVEYITILKIYLQKNELEMSGYQGADSYSIMNTIRCLPASIYKTYQIFELYFKGILFKINRMQKSHIFTIMFILVSIVTIFYFLEIYKKNKAKALLFALLIFLYPVVSVSVLIIATDAAFSLQMACGPALFLAALPCLFQWRECSSQNKTNDAGDVPLQNILSIIYRNRSKMLSRIFSFFMVIVLYGSIYQVIIDQNIMYEGRIATENIVDLVTDKLLQEDLMSYDYRYVFVGAPCGSLLYSIDSNYEHANSYALYGAWYSGSNGAKSWRGVIRYRKGLNLNMVTGSEYEDLSYSETVTDMPQFPEDGSILLENDIVYVKISNAN